MPTTVNETALPGSVAVLERLAPNIAEAVAADLRVPVEIERRFVAAREAADRDMRDEARTRAIADAGTKAVADLDGFAARKVPVLASRLAGIDQQIAAKLAVKKPTDPGSAVAYALAQAEIRRMVSELPAVEALALYLEATDPALLDAFETGVCLRRGQNGAPRLVPIIDPDRVAAARAARAESVAPDEVKLRREIELVLSMITQFVGSARATILDAVPTLRPAPVPLSQSK